MRRLNWALAFLVTLCVFRLAGMSHADQVGNDGAIVTTAPYADLIYGVDYLIVEPITGMTLLNRAICDPQVRGCNDQCAPCQWVLAGSKCRYCNAPLQARYCRPHPSEQCVSYGSASHQCGTTFEGTCQAGPPNCCGGFVIIVGDNCVLKECAMAAS